MVLLVIMIMTMMITIITIVYILASHMIAWQGMLGHNVPRMCKRNTVVNGVLAIERASVPSELSGIARFKGALTQSHKAPIEARKEL
jgi:hypothetical protein